MSLQEIKMNEGIPRNNLRLGGGGGEWGLSFCLHCFLLNCSLLYLIQDITQVVKKICTLFKMYIHYLKVLTNFLTIYTCISGTITLHLHEKKSPRAQRRWYKCQIDGKNQWQKLMAKTNGILAGWEKSLAAEVCFFHELGNMNDLNFSLSD